MDIVVQLEDGSIANVEIQKIGYAFPGERSACYSADLLLRQYKMVRSKATKDTFSYRQIKSVYTIVLFEKSPGEFQLFPNNYIHYFQQKSNTGLKLDLLQRFVFISLDIYQKNTQNKSIGTRLDAWLTFLSTDHPENIITLIEKYPDFKAMYEQIYEICQNIEKVIEMFSKELYEMDRNTVHYMIDEMQKEIDQKDREIDQKDKEIDQKDKEIGQKDKEIGQKDKEIDRQKEELSQKEIELERSAQALREALKRIEELETQ